MRSAYSKKKSTSAASASAPQETEPTDTVIFDGDAYVLSTSKTDQVELEKLHNQMYDRQCHGGRFHPGPKSKYDLAKMDEQVECDHPREAMRWGRHQHSIYASCTKCNLKTVVLYSKKKDEPAKVFTVGDKTIQGSECGPLAMIDTGCRRSVAGQKWHQTMQK